MNIKQELCRIAGKGNYFDSAEYVRLYSYDSQAITGKPLAVVFARSIRQISRVLKFCNNNHISVVPRGSGSGMTGGAVPLRRKSIILSFSKMDKIIDFKPENLIAKVEPGIINQDFNHFLNKHGFFYPPDPASAAFCTIGGNAAENAGGPSAVKYGVTSNYIINLKVVLPNGSVIETNNDLLKTVTGYNLTQLFVGSEGTLGAIAEVTVKILPKPKHSSTLLFGFGTHKEISLFVTKLYARGILPLKLEFMDRKAMMVTDTSAKMDMPHGLQGLLLMQVNAESENGVSQQVKAIEAVASEFKPKYVFLPENSDDEARIWEIRKAISPALYRFKPIKVNEDVVVPVGKLEQLFELFYEIENRYNADIISFGHIGDGNLHTNIMLDQSQKYQRAEILRLLFKNVVALGGSISGEHGIGITKRAYISIEKPRKILSIYRQIKQLFDPNNIMNPGKAI